MPEGTPDDSPLQAEASNAVLRAVRDAAAEASPEAAVSLVLEHARRALGAERAFLVEEALGNGPPSVLGTASIRQGEERPSRAAARHLLAAGRAALADSPSMRALELRAVFGAPLPDPALQRRALVLDSRWASHPEPRDLAALVEGFAAVLALVASRLPPRTPDGSDDWVGASAPYRSLMSRTRAVAASTLPVLIAGESGTGKEGVARRIHAGGARASGPFVAVNCAAVPEALLEGELFGSMRGAYTGAERDRAGLFVAADGGTLFLDEVGDMPLPMQAKLLRVLQERRVRAVGSTAERPVDVRILSASHRDLPQACAQRTFRSDLFYRLAVLVVRVPPLRERLADLPLLVTFLLGRLGAQAGTPWCRPSPEALKVLRSHSWPGNVRELESVLARAAMRAGGGILGPEHVELELPAHPAIAPVSGETFEQAMIRAALSASSGSMTVAASRIGWTRQKLYRRMVALGIYPASGSADGTRSSASSTFQ